MEKAGKMDFAGFFFLKTGSTQIMSKGLFAKDKGVAMAILWTILIGFFIGLIARFLRPGNDRMGFVLTTVLGIVGAFVGSFLGQAVGIYQAGEPSGFIGSVVGAIIVLMFLQFLKK